LPIIDRGCAERRTVCRFYGTRERSKSGLNFTLKTDLGDILLLGEMLGVGGYAEALQASSSMSIHGLDVRVLDLDGLARAKRAAGRVKDLVDLAEIAELKKR
jgi:hypothetical protein